MCRSFRTRNEAAGVIDSISEFVHVCEQTGAHLHVSHVKLVGVPHLLSDLLHTLSSAQDRSASPVISIRTGRQHPAVGAAARLCLRRRSPGHLERVRDHAERERMARDMEAGLPNWENLFGACGPENIVITQAGGDRSDAVSKTVAEVAEATGTDRRSRSSTCSTTPSSTPCMIDHHSTEKVVREIFSSSGALVGSDGVFNPHPHPRLYGTAPRVLGRYALREKLITVSEAIRRFSTGPPGYSVSTTAARSPWANGPIWCSSIRRAMSTPPPTTSPIRCRPASNSSP